MADREKLIELLKEANAETAAKIERGEIEDAEIGWEFLADHLIANGVTVQRWIPVTERLPKEGQTVIACVLHRFGDKSVSAKIFWNATYANWQDVTYWMPLPEPPKGENG